MAGIGTEKAPSVRLTEPGHIGLGPAVHVDHSARGAEELDPVSRPGRPRRRSATDGSVRYAPVENVLVKGTRITWPDGWHGDGPTPACRVLPFTASWEAAAADRPATA